jgi:hypothetical protein
MIVSSFIPPCTLLLYIARIMPKFKIHSIAL